MNILVLCVDRLRSAPLKVLCEDYMNRLRRYGRIEVLEVQASVDRSPAVAMKFEAPALLRHVEPHDKVWVLDNHGTQCGSRDFARKLSDLENRSTKRLVVILGSTHGLDEMVKERGEVLALSRLTFPHELCRAILLEQLYRARTIQRGEPYHH